MTLNQLIALFQAIGDAHFFIKTTEFGEVPDKVDANTEDTIYPAFYQVPTNTITRDASVERSYTLFVCDLVDPGHENLNEVLSDTEQTLNDILKILRQESDDYTLINDPQLTPFKDGFGDAVAGWYAEVTIQTANNTAYCDIPAIDFGYPGGGGTPGIPQPSFDCDDLVGCPVIETIESTLVDLQEQIDNLPPGGGESLAQTLVIGNSTGNQLITAGTNLSNILQVTDTVMGLSWNGTIGGNLTLDDSGTYLYSDAPVFIESQDSVNITGPIVNVTGDNFIVNETGAINLFADSAAIMEADNSLFLGRISIQTKPFTSYISLYTFDETAAGGGASFQMASTATDSTMVISSTFSAFAGAQYDADFSANYTSRSLVDKAYVDSLTPAAPSLASVLAVGNDTGGYTITSPDGNGLLYVIDGQTLIGLTSGVNTGKLEFFNNESLLFNDVAVTLQATTTKIKNLVGDSYLNIETTVSYTDR